MLAMLLPAPQPVMLVIQMLVARLFGIRNLGNPATLFHYPLGTEDGFFVMVVSVDTVLVGDQVSVVDVPPAITIPDVWDVPRRVVDRTGDELTNLD